jgi:hypothetical protein
MGRFSQLCTATRETEKEQSKCGKHRVDISQIAQRALKKNQASENHHPSLSTQQESGGASFCQHKMYVTSQFDKEHFRYQTRVGSSQENKAKARKKWFKIAEMERRFLQGRFTGAWVGFHSCAQQHVKPKKNRASVGSIAWTFRKLHSERSRKTKLQKNKPNAAPFSHSWFLF